MSARLEAVKRKASRWLRASTTRVRAIMTAAAGFKAASRAPTGARERNSPMPTSPDETHPAHPAGDVAGGAVAAELPRRVLWGDD